MPLFMGILRQVRRPGRPGRPDIGLPEEEDGPEVQPPEGELPEDPPGVWPPLEGPDFPLFPVDPDEGGGEGGGEGGFEPGEIWPPIRPPGGEKPSLPRPPVAPGQPLPKRLFFAACRIPGYGWRWVVVDLNKVHRPDLPAGGLPGRPPQRPGPGPAR